MDPYIRLENDPVLVFVTFSVHSGVYTCMSFKSVTSLEFVLNIK